MSQNARRLRRRLLPRTGRVPTLLTAAVVASLMLAAWVVVAGDVVGPPVGPHLFYLPVVVAAAILGVPGGVATAAVAAGLMGTALATPTVAEWLLPALLYVLVGVVVGLVASSRADGLAREREVARREQALVAQRAALVQLVSHEFRTPLTVIHGSLETLRRREGAVAPPFVQLVEATGRSVDRLEELVDVVLGAADELDVDEARQSGIEVRDLVRHAAVSLRPAVLDRLELHVPTHAVVTTVEPYLWLALRCLLDNAARFSPPDQPIEIHYGRRDGTVAITVRDHGPGLPDGFEEHAFEPFAQGDPSERRGPGLGMGLYTSRRLLRRLGGDVTIATSGNGTGVAATMRLPQRREADARGAPRSRPDAQPRANAV